MGGSIAVTIIEENGQVHKMERWTNSLPDFIKSLKFVNKEQAHLQEYLDLWLPMKADWEQHGPNGPFEYPGTTDFFPGVGLAPSEYGLLVVDYQQNKLYSIQDYVSVDRVERLNLNEDEELDENDFYYERNQIFEAFQQAGRILGKEDSHDQRYTSGKLSLAPFEIVSLEKNATNMQIMKRLLDENYGLNPEEKTHWEAYIADMVAYEAEV